MAAQFNEIMKNAPAWLTPEMVLIGGGVLVALLLLWLISRLTRRRPVEAELVETDHYAAEIPPARPIAPPPVAPAPPALAEPPLAPPAPPVFEPAPEPERPAAAAEPDPLAWPEPEPIAEAPEPAPLADEPIAAAAPFDASPASLAADVPEPVAPPPPATDDLTRMKGIGPRLANRLVAVGITSFAQIAALTPEDAEALDARLGDFQGRIHRDRWIEQAGYLASGDTAGFEDKFGKL